MENEIVYFNVEYLFYIVYRFLVGDPTKETATTTPVDTPVETPTTEQVTEVTGVSPDGITFWDIFTLTIVIVSLILAVAIVYAVIRMSQIRSQVQQAYSVYERGGTGSVADITAHPQETPIVNERWERVLAGIDSNDPHEWQQAVTNAGAMLESGMNRAGARGGTFDERLFSLRKDAGVLEQARRGYRELEEVTSGGDVILTQQKARSIVTLFEPLLTELGEI